MKNNAQMRLNVKTKQSKKVWRMLLWVLLFFVLCAVTLQLSFFFYFNSKFKADIQQEFRKQTGGEYELVIRKLNTNVFIQSVFISGFSVRPVKGIRPELAKYHISSEEINLVNFELFSFLFRRDLKFYSLELANPELTVFRNKVDVVPKNAEVQKVKFSIYRLLKSHIRALSIKNIDVHDAKIKVYADDKDSLLLLNNMDNELIISGLRIDEEAERYGHLFLAEKTELAIHKFSFTTQDSLYTVKVARVTASYTDSSVYMDSLQLIPNYSKKNFARFAKEQTDRIKISCSKVKFNRMDVKLFFEKNWFIAGYLQIKDFNVEAYRDKNDTRKPHIPRSIQALIRDIPIKIKIDSILVRNAVCSYEEVAEGATIPGRIHFNKVNAVITGFSNRFPGDPGSAVLAVHASCMLMNKARLHVYYGFPLNTEKMVFDCSGSLYDMPFTEMNKVLEPIAKVSAVQGEIDTMIFSFHAGDQYSEGEMKLLYHDLKIQILKKKDGLHNQVEHIFSFLAHSFIIKENNPTRNQSVRITRIHYLRDTERFIFNYSLKSLLSGIKTSIGLPGSSKRIEVNGKGKR